MAIPTIDYIAAWATFGTALGTLGLAGATFVLALKTRALATSGQETADAAKLAAKAADRDAREAARAATAAEGLLAAQLEPQIIDVPAPGPGPIVSADPEQPIFPPGAPPPASWPKDDRLERGEIRVLPHDGGIGYCTFPIRNVGPGLARIRQVAFVIGGRPSEPAWYLSKRFLPNGEETRITIRVRSEEHAFADFHQAANGGLLIVRVRYSAADDERARDTSFHLVRLETGRG